MATGSYGNSGKICAEIQNLHLQSLGAKTTGKIWISSLISKMWDVAWDLWNFRNHTIYATECPRKIEIINLINKRVTRHPEKGTIGLPIRCHFLFHTSIHTLITRPIQQCLFWIAATTNSRQCFHPHASTRRLPDTDKLLFGIITMGRLIPTLYQIDEDPPLRTKIVPHPPYIGREDYPNPLSQHCHDLSLAQAWDSR